MTFFSTATPVGWFSSFLVNISPRVYNQYIIILYKICPGDLTALPTVSFPRTRTAECIIESHNSLHYNRFGRNIIIITACWTAHVSVVVGCTTARSRATTFSSRRHRRSVARRLVVRSASAVGLRGKQSRLDAHRRDVQLATGPPPLVGHQGHGQQVATAVRHHGWHAAGTRIVNNVNVQ